VRKNKCNCKLTELNILGCNCDQNKLIADEISTLTLNNHVTKSVYSRSKNKITCNCGLFQYLGTVASVV
jgi:hypothetical protein